MMGIVIVRLQRGKQSILNISGSMNLARLQVFGNALIQRKIAECREFETGLRFNAIDVVLKQGRKPVEYFVGGD